MVGGRAGGRVATRYAHGRYSMRRTSKTSLASAAVTGVNEL